jgi:hypothetical protein
MKKYFLTFGDNVNFKIQRWRLREEANRTGWFDNCYLETPQSISDFIKQHKAIFDNYTKGFGLWLWKPFIILKYLEVMEEGDLLFYQDAGGSIIQTKQKRFDEYCQILQLSQKPIITFSVPAYREIHFQKLSLLKRFDLQYNQDFLNSEHIESGVVMMRKCQFTVDFIKHWLDTMIEQDYLFAKDDIGDELPSFIAYKEDQSVLSLLIKLHKVQYYPSESYGIGPFFSSRMSDSNLKHDAPDRFRTRLDYNYGKHDTWRTYHGDDDVINNLVEEVKGVIMELKTQLLFNYEGLSLNDQFKDRMVSHIDRIMYDFGLFSYTLFLDEFHPYTALSRQELTGKIKMRISTVEKTIEIGFKITEAGVLFTLEFDKWRPLFSQITITKTRIV